MIHRKADRPSRPDSHSREFAPQLLATLLRSLSAVADPKLEGALTHHSFADTTIPAAYGAYSHAVVAGGLAFLAGQIARDGETGKLIEGDISRQTERCIEIVAEILRELGLGLGDVVKSTVYLSDIDDFSAMNEVYSRMFTPPYPARSTPEVKLPFGALVGIEVVARADRINRSES